MIHGERLAEELRRDHEFIHIGRTRDREALIMRKGKRWTVVPLRELTQDAVDTIKAQAGIALV